MFGMTEHELSEAIALGALIVFAIFIAWRWGGDKNGVY